MQAHTLTCTLILQLKRYNFTSDTKQGRTWVTSSYVCICNDHPSSELLCGHCTHRGDERRRKNSCHSVFAIGIQRTTSAFGNELRQTLGIIRFGKHCSSIIVRVNMWWSNVFGRHIYRTGSRWRIGFDGSDRYRGKDDCHFSSLPYLLHDPGIACSLMWSLW